jgi:hypothetical protein
MFHWGLKDTAVRAMLYRHSDGYPEGVLPDLEEFFDDLDKNLSDKRYGDPSYLAPKLLVWLVMSHRQSMKEWYESMLERNPNDNYAREKLAEKSHICDFLGHGIDNALHGDIEYLYHINCPDIWGGEKASRPKITWERVTDEVQERYKYLLESSHHQVKYPKGAIKTRIPKERV